MDATVKRTQDGFISYRNNKIETGLNITISTDSNKLVDNRIYDVIIIGAGFAGLIAARELSCRGRSVLIIEAKDRIGGRTFTTQIDNHQYEIGGTWVHWSQPHIWSEITRYKLSLIESDGAMPEHISVLLENGTKLKTFPISEIYPKLFDLMEKFCDVDNVKGRAIFPFPHEPLHEFEAVRAYDHMTMQDRFEQISNEFDNDTEMKEILNAYLSMNTQCDLAKSGFIDHLCFWTLGDHDTIRNWDKTSRYKIREGMSALAQAIFNDCQQANLLLSTPVISIQRTSDNEVEIKTKDGRLFIGRTAIITIPLNALHNIEFRPTLEFEKQRSITEGQCHGGTKFLVELESSVGNWCGFASYPNPITVAYTENQEGTTIVGFGPDNALDIRNITHVEHELQKFLPNCKVKYVFGHDWRSDLFIQSTWSWYKPGQTSENLRALQSQEEPLFFASSDWANSWRGCVDGAIQSALTSVRQVQQYLRYQNQ